MSVRTFDPTQKKEYPGFTNYPFFHRSGKMPWAAAAVLDMSKIDKLIFCSGQTGRDPETDREPLDWDEERARVGRLVGPGVTEQTIACWTRIKETLDGLGVRMEHIVYVHYYLVNRDDWWDMWHATHDFFQQHAPDLTEHPRAATLLKGIQLDLPGQLIEIEVTAIIPKK